MSTVVARPRTPGGWVAAVGATDHKIIAARVFVAAFGFFLAAGILALLMRTELAAPGMQVVTIHGYDELFTIHGSTMFYLFASPMAMALGMYIVPLQVGAPNIAFPRLSLAGFWLLVFGGIAMWSGFLTESGAFQSGWYAYPPLSNATYTPGDGSNYWCIGVILAALASLAMAFSILWTIIRHRAPGMTMIRMSMFTWSMVVTVLMVLTSYWALIVAMVMLYLDRTLGTGIYNPPNGPVLYQQFFWFFGHPIVYVVFFPALGAAAEAISVFSAKRWFGYKFLVMALLTFAALSMTVYGHHMFTTYAVTNRYFALTSTALLIPAGIEYFDSVGTMWRGRIRFHPAFLFAIGFLLLFLIGGLTGIWIGSPPLNYQATDSYWIVGHFHFTLFGGTVMGTFAAIYLWFPKVTGALLRERLGRIHFYLTMIGAPLTFIPMFFLGNDGMPRRVATYPASYGWQGMNELATAGAYVIFLSVAVFLVNVAVSLTWRRPAGDDPFNGHALEWATSSPPPPHNFDALPPIHSYAPLLDIRERMEDEVGARGVAVTQTPAGEPGA